MKNSYSEVKNENDEVASRINKKFGFRQIRFHHVNFNDRKLEKMIGIKPSSVPDQDSILDSMGKTKINDKMTDSEIASALSPDEMKVYRYSKSLNRIVWNRVRNSVVNSVSYLLEIEVYSNHFQSLKIN